MGRTGNGVSLCDGSDTELDTGAAELHPNYDTGIIAPNPRAICGGVTGLFAASAAGNVA